MINPAWPEIAKATPANLHHHMGHDPNIDEIPRVDSDINYPRLETAQHSLRACFYTIELNVRKPTKKIA